MKIIRTKNGQVVYRVDSDTYKLIEDDLNKIFVSISRKKQGKLNNMLRLFMISAFKDGYDEAYAEVGL